MLVGSLLYVFASLRSPDQITISTGPSDFGEVYVTDRFQWTLPITNLTTKPVTISSIKASCSCTDVGHPTFTIPGGHVHNLNIALDLRPKGTNISWPHRFAAEISINLLDGGNYICQLRGTVKKHPLQWEDGSLEWDIWPGRAHEGRLVRISSAEPVSSVKVSCDPPDVATISLPEIDESGKMVSMQVFLTSMHDRPDRFTLLVQAVSEHGRKLPTMRLPAIIRSIPSCIISPSAIVLGRRRIGEISEATVSLHLRDKNLQIEGVTASEQCDVTVEHLKADMDMRLPDTVMLRIPITELGAQSFDLALNAKASGDVIRLHLPVKYVGYK